MLLMIELSAAPDRLYLAAAPLTKNAWSQYGRESRRCTGHDNGDIEVSRESPGSFARRAVEDLQRFGDVFNVDIILRSHP
jgi:hypothetical protein